jgi:hypothetical protein
MDSAQLVNASITLQENFTLNKTIPMTKVCHHACDALDDPSSHENYVTLVLDYSMVLGLTDQGCYLSMRLFQGPGSPVMATILALLALAKNIFRLSSTASVRERSLK